MVHDDVASGYPISIGFYRLTDCQWDPRDRGVTSSTHRLQFFLDFHRQSVVNQSKSFTQGSV